MGYAVIVCGGRDFTDHHFVFETLTAFDAALGIAAGIEVLQPKKDPQS